MVDEEEVTEALSNVIDPELGLDFVELGLVYGVEIDGGIGPATIADAYAAGANRLTAGSAIYSAPDPGAAYQALVEQVRAVEPPAWA